MTARHRSVVQIELLFLPFWCECASVRRPSQPPDLIVDFEGKPQVCNFAEGNVLFDDYAASLVRFSGPGFGALNGGVIMGACALGSLAFPPLSNSSFDGSNFLGFSTLHILAGQAKPLSPETIKFDVRMTNIVLALAGIDDKTATVELYSGPGDSFDDAGVLLHTFTLQMSAVLQRFELVDENELFVDCVRRMVIYSPAKLFVLDDLQYSVSQASDGVCKDSPSQAESSSLGIGVSSGVGRAVPPSWAIYMVSGIGVALFLKREQI